MAKNSRPENPQPAKPRLVPVEKVYPRAKYLPLKPNNYRFDPTIFRCPHPVLTSILLKHPLWPLFHETASVPEVYLQQFWGTLEMSIDVNPHRIQAQIANTTVSFSSNRLRKILQLPAANEAQGRETYRSRFSEARMCQDLKRLGYLGPLDKVPEFQRNRVAQPWSTLFVIVNKCLSGKACGHDKCSTNFMNVYHGIVFNHHYNYAAIFWKEFCDLIQHKTARKRTFLPHWRFFAIIIKYFMDRHPEIPKRPDTELVTPKTLEYVQKEDPIPNVQAMIIPEYLLSMANQNTPAIRCYRKLHNLFMSQPEPEDPTPENSPIRSEGPKHEGQQGGVGVCEANPTPENSPIGSEGPKHEGQQGGVGVCELEGERSDDYDRVEDKSGDENDGGHDGDDNNDDDNDDVTWDLFYKERRSKAFFNKNTLESLANVAQAIERERKEVSEKQAKEKKKDESKKKKKKKSKKERKDRDEPEPEIETQHSGEAHESSYVNGRAHDMLLGEQNEGVPSLIHSSLASPVGTGTDMFSTGIEVIVNSAMPVFTPTSQSAVSQQIVVSLVHGEQPHNLMFPQSEEIIIESSGQSSVKSYLTDKGKTLMPETPFPMSPPRLRLINVPPPVSHPTQDSGLSNSQLQTILQKMDAQHATLLAEIEKIKQTQTTHDNSIQQLIREVRVLKETCKVQAGNQKRKHDDADDSHHHEGEKRQKTSKTQPVLIDVPIQVRHY